MRRTNFVEPVRTHVGQISALLWALAIAMFAGSAWMFIEARELNAAADKLGAQAVQLGRELSVIGAEDVGVPTEVAFTDLANRIDRFNSLSGERHTSLLALLSALENALPENVWVTQMSYSVETGAFGVSLFGESETELPLALQRIEAIEELTNVILERQVRVQSGTRNLLQYDIRAVAE